MELDLHRDVHQSILVSLDDLFFSLSFFFEPEGLDWRTGLLGNPFRAFVLLFYKKMFAINAHSQGNANRSLISSLRMRRSLSSVLFFSSTGTGAGALHAWIERKAQRSRPKPLLCELKLRSGITSIGVALLLYCVLGATASFKKLFLHHEQRITSYT